MDTQGIQDHLFRSQRKDNEELVLHIIPYNNFDFISKGYEAIATESTENRHFRQPH